MNQVFYLESDEEITKVIDRIRKSDEDGVVLVIPRGSSMAQSIINLKLLKRTARDLKKGIALVCAEKTAEHLAERLEIPVFHKVHEAESAKLKKAVDVPKHPEIVEEEVIKAGGEEEPIQINTYQKYDLSKLNDPNIRVAEQRSSRETEEDSDEEAEQRSSGAAEGIQTVEPEEATDFSEPETAPSPENFAVAAEQPIDFAQGRQRSREAENIRAAEQDDDRIIHRRIEIREPEEILQRRVQIKTGGSRRMPAFLSAIIVIIILIILLGCYITLPKATASLTLTTSDINKEYDVTADRNQTAIDQAKMVFPGRIITAEKSDTKQYPATGTKDIGVKATGKITISNANNSQPQTIPAGAIFSSNGKNFISNAAVTVPGAQGTFVSDANGKLVPQFTAGTIDVAVTAENAGPAYNIAPSDFVISSLSAAKQSYLSGKSTVAFAGGTTQVIKVVTSDDLAKAQADLQASLTTTAATDLKADATKAGLTILDTTVKGTVASFDSDKKENDQADNFNLTMKVSASVIGFDEKALRTIAVATINAGLKSNEMIVDPENNEIAYSVVTNDVDAGTLKLHIVFKGKIGTKLDASAIASSIKDKSISEAESSLDKIDGVKSSTVTVSPSFIKQLPLLKNHITVKFDYAK